MAEQRVLDRPQAVAGCRYRGSGPDRHAVGIRWRKGLGVIGRCWQTQMPQKCDFSELTERYLKDNDAAGWAALAPEERWNMEWADMLRTKRYGGVAAAPMFALGDSPKFKGCVSLDGPSGSYAPLSTFRVQECMRELAACCASVLYYRTGASR